MSYELPYDAFLRTLKENTDTGHSFLLGAGASISSGIQSATDCIWEWKKNIFITKNPSLSRQYSEYKSETVQRSVQKWLNNEGGYPSEGAVEEYSFYALKAYPIDDTRRKYFENICRNKEPHLGYKLLCLLAKYGMARVVFTTNFDGLVEKAAHQAGLTPIAVALDSTERIHRAASSSELLTVALHGDFKYGPLKNTGSELDTQHDTFIAALSQHLYDKHLIVIGYSGRDKSLMDALKKAYSKPGAGMLFWCGFGYNINADIEDLLNHLKAHNRQGFYIATEGFDTILNDASRTCFDNNEPFKKDVAQILQENPDGKSVKTPFSMETNVPHVLLRSNLFPIKLPTEAFQFEISFQDDESAWKVINEAIDGKSIVAVPLKGMICGFGTQSQIREIFSKRLKGEIGRTPITYREIKERTVFGRLYLKAIIQSLCELYSLKSDGFEKIYLPNSKQTQTKDGLQFNLYDAIELAFSSDANIYAANPFMYLSIKPTFYLEADTEIPKSVKLEVGRTYHDNLLRTQPNIKYNNQLDRWISILFPGGRSISFEYPLNSGTGFKFAMSANTMHATISKAQWGYALQLPDSFDQRQILRKGIQYNEPYLEFVDRNSGQILTDFHPMRGLVNNRPYDYSLNGNVFDPEVNLGVVCPSQYNNVLYDFLNRLNKTQAAGSFNPDYLIDYPNFNNAYGVPLNVPDVNSDLWKECIISLPTDNLMQSANELAEKIKKAIDQFEAVNKKLVVVIFIPKNWNVITDIHSEHEKFDLHDYIKAYAAQKQIATQFIQEKTLSDSLTCQVNWWLSLSLYVKSQRTPWVLNGLERNTAFVGIGYSIKKSDDRNKVVLGCSHIYNSFGQGLKYRLSRVEDCYFDKQRNPYLSYQDAYKFGNLIRELFFNAMGEIPKRVVVHKRTHFKPDEIRGIVDCLKKSDVQQIDLIEVNFEDNARFVSLFVRDGQITPGMYPLSRGSCFLIDNSTALLWTHGIVPSVKAGNRSYYLGGKNIPIPLKIRKHYGHSNIGTIATEILGLTKMNWNSFDLYSKLPATIQTSNEIARIGWLLNRFEGKTYDYRNFM